MSENNVPQTDHSETAQIEPELTESEQPEPEATDADGFDAEHHDEFADDSDSVFDEPPAHLIAPSIPTEVPADYRSGFAAFVGRPNVGKSTLTNALVGQKVAITSDKPQTTRHAIRGVLTTDDGQLIIVDTPGLHRPRNLLGKRLNEVVLGTLSEVDVVGICLPADQKIGPGDRFILDQLKEHVRAKTPIIALLTKTDLVSKVDVFTKLTEIAELMDFADIVPCSAESGFQTDAVRDVFMSHLPHGPQWYPEGVLTDEPEEKLIAELVREAALEGVREELPHSIAAQVVEIVERKDRDDDMVDVHVTIYVERDSQKGIVIGKKGERLKRVGVNARQQITKLLGVPVNLQLHVSVAPDWQRDPKQLRKLGFE